MVLKLYIESHDTWIQSIIQYIPHISSSLEECDYIISTKIPWGSTNLQLIQDVLNSYKYKKAIIFLVSDYNEPFDIPNNVLLFRTGMYKSLQKSNEYLLPYPITKSDLRNEPPFEPLPKKGLKPIVGFCGSIISHPSRIQYINKLKQVPNIKKNIIIKTEYWGGKPHNIDVVEEFIKNIKDSYFTLSTRGTGNWSARFYQVLYLGRIPLVVNTDLVLPFEDRINWSGAIVLCDSENDIENNLKNFWNTQDIVQAQIKCKEIYYTYLDMEKWCKIITEEILIYNK
jgi:hypothetical protein